MNIVEIIAWSALFACTAWTLAGLLSVVYARTRSPRPNGVSLPVSVLKPLCGVDEGLLENLETFFRQAYAPYELVFGVGDARDPALDVVRSLRARYPDVPCKIVVHERSIGMNPKVANLASMLPAAQHDLVLVSDSNVVAPANYITDAVCAYSSRVDVGLVTHLFAGIGEDGLGAALESVQLNGFCAAGTALPTSLGDAAVVGKSMLFSRSAFDRLGGFSRVQHVLAEDFVMGKTFQHAGYAVQLGTVVLGNVTRGISVRAFMDRQLRWCMLRSRLRPAAYLLEPLTSPVALLPAAALVLGPFAVAWAVCLLLFRDVGGWLVLRGPKRVWLPLVLAPLRELCMLVVWARAPFKRHVSWRGRRLRLGAGTLLFDPAPRRFTRVSPVKP